MQTWSKPDLNMIQTLSNPNLDTDPNLILTTWSQNDKKKTYQTVIQYWSKLYLI